MIYEPDADELDLDDDYELTSLDELLEEYAARIPGLRCRQSQSASDGESDGGLRQDTVTSGDVAASNITYMPTRGPAESHVAAEAGLDLCEAVPPCRKSSIVVPKFDDCGDLDECFEKNVVFETNLARLSVFADASKRSRSGSQEFRRFGDYLGQPFWAKEPMGPLSMREGVVTAYLSRRYVNMGCPTDRVVPIRIGQVEKLLGHSRHGGWQTERAQQSLEKLRTTIFRGSVRFETERWERHEWGVLESLQSHCDSLTGVVLDETLASLLAIRSQTYLDRQTLHTLLAKDQVAARLWMFLESERFHRLFKYGLFAAQIGHVAKPRMTPEVSMLLRIESQRRWDCERRVARASAWIARCDPRYSLRVEAAQRRGVRRPGMWNLVVVKSEGSFSKWS